MRSSKRIRKSEEQPTGEEDGKAVIFEGGKNLREQWEEKAMKIMEGRLKNGISKISVL